jgi:hypothetical protein
MSQADLSASKYRFANKVFSGAADSASLASGDICKWSSI